VDKIFSQLAVGPLSQNTPPCN